MWSFSGIFVTACFVYMCVGKNLQPISVVAFLKDTHGQMEIPIRNAVWVNRYSLKNLFEIDFQNVPISDCFLSAKNLCSTLSRNASPIAVISSESRDVSPLFQAIAEILGLPYIQTSWKYHNSYIGEAHSLNFYPDPRLLSMSLAAVLKSLNWRSCVVLYEDQEGLFRLQEVLNLQNDQQEGVPRIVAVRRLVPRTDYREVLKEVRDLRENRFLVDSSSENILEILQAARDVGLMERYHQYFLTSLDAATVNISPLNIRSNITIISLIDYKSPELNAILQEWERNEYREGRVISLEPEDISIETILVHDAISSLFEAVNTITAAENFVQKNVSCKANATSHYGSRIVALLKTIPALSGRESLSRPIEFDDLGRRVDFNIYVLDGHTHQVLATWNAKNPDRVILEDWESRVPQELLARSNGDVFVVSTRAAEPYVMIKETHGISGNVELEGFIIDLMDEISRISGYKFEYRLTEDGQYGTYVPEQDTWTGLIGDVIEHRATFAVTDLTITPERKKFVDFSVPFLTLGIGLLMKDTGSEVGMFDFLKPFSAGVWLFIATLYLIVSIALWLVARMAPADWENLHPCNRKPATLQNIWNSRNCFWIMMGSIMNQGSDIYPKGISSRTATALWWFFALIVTNSYMANLAAFLTKDQQSSIRTIEDLAEQSRVVYGMLEGGTTEEFFRQSNYSVYRKMYAKAQLVRPTVFEKSNADGVRRVQNTRDGGYAFFLESTNIEYETETKCDLKQVGGWLQPKVFGIAMPQDCQYRNKINDAILRLQAVGNISSLKDKWWQKLRKEPSCPPKKAKGAELDFEELRGVFLVLFVGLAVAVLIGVFEFLWNVKKISVNKGVPLEEAFKAEVSFAIKFWVTRKKVDTKKAVPFPEKADCKQERKRSYAQVNTLFTVNVLNKN